MSARKRTNTTRIHYVPYFGLIISSSQDFLRTHIRLNFPLVSSFRDLVLLAACSEYNLCISAASLVVAQSSCIGVVAAVAVVGLAMEILGFDVKLMHFFAIISLLPKAAKDRSSSLAALDTSFSSFTSPKEAPTFVKESKERETQSLRMMSLT